MRGGEKNGKKGWVMREWLGYNATSKEEGKARCNQNQQQFVIQTVTIENGQQCVDSRLTSLCFWGSTRAAN